jgi:hypothetical protein
VPTIRASTSAHFARPLPAGQPPLEVLELLLDVLICSSKARKPARHRGLCLAGSTKYRKAIRNGAFGA